MLAGTNVAFARLGADVKPLTQGGFDFGQLIANSLADFKERQQAVSGEFVNGPQRQAAMDGEIAAADFLLGEDWCCL